MTAAIALNLGSSRRLQIRLFYRHECQRRVRHRFRARQHHSAAGNLLLHLRADQFPGRCQARANAAVSLCALCLVRVLLSAAGRRTDYPIQRDRAAIRSPATGPRLRRGSRGRPHDVHHWPLEKDGSRRRRRAIRIAGVHRGGTRRGDRPADGMGRRPGLHVPAVFRLFRIFRHGDRRGALFRHSLSDEFRFLPTSPPALSSSGGAGISPCRASCAIICISGSAAIAAARYGDI